MASKYLVSDKVGIGEGRERFALVAQKGCALPVGAEPHQKSSGKNLTLEGG
jgi:hypothetical protein